MSTTAAPRVVDPELIEKLDPIEKLIAKKFIMEGRWQVVDQEDKREETD